ncbi:ribosomal RNA-processing protein 8-like [Myxocyprinus asiaticus]|uniref:ribosomal RNA-processing protein 8-like n=1 Tax=Myxocyprinus asiaticus TaxID=70543 RepID=UPI0022236C4D|nr:ribosomal RNA-processing protein 8-like [Myxocyprinus asiaticus]
MFAEEEWTDSPSPDGSTQAVAVSPVTGKEKVVGKRSLLRTLQTLGSVPEWETGKPIGDSDEETEDTPSVKTKKKSCEKRKRTSTIDNEGKQQNELESPETPVKKKSVKKIIKETSSKTSQESKKEVSDKKGAQIEKEKIQTEKRLSRKQWRNRMKNKRHCKNKYLPKTTGANNAKAKEEALVQTQDDIGVQKVQKNDKPSKKMKKSCEKNGISSVVDNTENCRDSMSSDHIKSIAHETSCAEPRIVDDSLSNNKVSHEVGDKGKPCKMSKISKLRADKLCHVINLHLTDESNKATEEREPKDKTVKSKGDEEQTPLDRSSALRSKMEKRLEAARFRHINELLYTSTSGEAKRMFQQDPEAIGIYHKGYTAQVQHWPANPVDSIISYIHQRPASLVVADFGCGDCKIARSVKNKVHSFDLAPVCELATACDMAKVPLCDSTVDIAVFCLSLMGTNLVDFLAEANRVLVKGGILKIAEVASRFESVRSFLGALSSLGFKLVSKDTENSHFYSFEFIKTEKAPENVKKVRLQLKPCLYKKR